MFLTTVDRGEPKTLGLDKLKIETKEQLGGLLNKALSIVCEQHSKAFKEVQELASRALKLVVEMRDTLLKEIDTKYKALCEEVLEAEEEGEGGKCKVNTEMARLRFSVPSKCAVVWGLKMGLICAQPVFDPEGTEELFKPI